MSGNIRLGCILRSEKGKAYCEDDTRPVNAGVGLSACSSNHCGTYRVNDLTIKDHITHLWLIIVDPITYLSHSTTM